MQLAEIVDSLLSPMKRVCNVPHTKSSLHTRKVRCLKQKAFPVHRRKFVAATPFQLLLSRSFFILSSKQSRQVEFVSNPA